MDFSNSEHAPLKPFTTCATSITIVINVIVLQQKHLKNVVPLKVSKFAIVNNVIILKQKHFKNVVPLSVSVSKFTSSLVG